VKGFRSPVRDGQKIGREFIPCNLTQCVTSPGGTTEKPTRHHIPQALLAHGQNDKPLGGVIFLLHYIYKIVVIAGVIYPFIRTVRTGRAISSFFICWGLLILLEVAIARGIPALANALNLSNAATIHEWAPLYVRTMTFLGWYYAGLAALFGQIIRNACVRLGYTHDPQREVKKPQNGCSPFGGIVLLALLGTPFFLISARVEPPSESSILKNFYTHRASFERLHEMLEVDDGLEGVAPWGVEYKHEKSKPPDGPFPVQRFNDYVALLKDIGARAAWRDDGPNPEIGISIFLSVVAFEMDNHHTNIHWVPVPPARQVSDFDLYLRNGKSTGTKGWVYCHIDGNWYIATDLGAD